jgi:hypothetical protein
MYSRFNFYQINILIYTDSSDGSKYLDKVDLDSDLSSEDEEEQDDPAPPPPPQADSGRDTVISVCVCTSVCCFSVS